MDKKEPLKCRVNKYWKEFVNLSSEEYRQIESGIFPDSMEEEVKIAYKHFIEIWNFTILTPIQIDVTIEIVIKEIEREHLKNSKSTQRSR